MDTHIENEFTDTDAFASSGDFDLNAVEAIMETFGRRVDAVFYEHQLAILLEDRFFHWVTTRALARLVAEGRLVREVVTMKAGRRKPVAERTSVPIHLYRLPRHRYWKRQARAIVSMVEEFSTESFGKALGRHGEHLFDSGLSEAGFTISARDVREFRGKRWPGGRELDRIYVRDGVAYGAEVKNSLGYIDPGELDEKLSISEFLGLKPLFIMRMAPKTYIHQIFEAGGYALIFKYQFYPFGQEQFGEKVRTRLGLPIGHQLAQRTVQRFLDWHLDVNPTSDSREAKAK